ncbi:conserved hypothetical protein [Paraburkholderia tropica]|uniref:hypothetical protein n=1 Tax=Paraburkholderia tropica TaxID=92647 RepID=UPI001CAA9ED7|nr:hypothetical protein [Paraburkholderia tropica]CAG9195443.1 conserved hypothetical protein [Paraburkholderia tropica]
MSMKRREFLGVSCAACCAMGWRGSQAAWQRSARIAVFDASLAEGAVLARHAAHTHMTPFAVDDDIGALWHARIAARVGEGAVVLCALRASDRFVFERLALSRRCVVMNVSL